MRTDLYWVEGEWPGRLAIMPRPRGGGWLEDEIQSWRRSGVDVIVSLRTPDEMTDLDLSEEEELYRANGIRFVPFPVSDRGVPPSQEAFSGLLTTLAGQLAEGKGVAVHCRQGIGRATLVAIGLLAMPGMDPEAAIQRISAARGCPVPETPEQRRWIAEFARSLMTRLAK